MLRDNEIFEWPWPTGAGADHILKRQWELVDLLSSRSPIFLDTKFWIMARQAAFEEVDDPDVVSLLGALRLAVESGRFIFPVTSDLIAEFSKQTPERLAQTMLLVDRLSLGVAMVPHHERTTFEMEAFNARAFPDHPPAPRPLWTCYAFALGYEDMCPPNVEANDALLVALAQEAWIGQPSMLAKMVPPELFASRSESERMAAYLNEQEALHAHEIDSHATALRIEIAGAASMLTGIAAREYRRMAAAAGHAREADDIENSVRVGRRVTGMLAQALEKDEHRRAFGSLYVPAMLHAAVRSEANRKIKPNDIFDFRHAAAALPYCRAFLTDGPLRSLITSGHVRLDRLYGCEIVATPAEAIELIGRLALS
ncbi:MAG: hypothetical protein HKN78_11820 [Sphingomonadaceae bacterium]|nr:hypothetical protein [Sphingomonadaceae bacterium]